MCLARNAGLGVCAGARSEGEVKEDDEGSSVEFGSSPDDLVTVFWAPDAIPH